MATKHAQETSADRWSSWRRAATVSVTPADTRLYRVVTGDAERIIGLDKTQLPSVGSGSVTTPSTYAVPPRRLQRSAPRARRGR